MKPENLLVTSEGLVVITDFECSKVLEGRPGETVASTTTHGQARRGFTPGYVAPEVCDV